MFFRRYGYCIMYGVGNEYMIHPDDLDSYIRFISKGYIIFEYINKSDDYLILKYNENLFRVNENLFRELPNFIAKFEIGEVVLVNTKKGEIKGIVVDRMWHYDKKEPFYFIKVENKIKSKRYFNRDLKKITEK